MMRNDRYAWHDKQPAAPTFKEMRDEALNALRYALNNGCFTERGLAKLAKMSQPQVHNVLKGFRGATICTLDKLCEAARIDRTGQPLHRATIITMSVMTNKKLHRIDDLQKTAAVTGIIVARAHKHAGLKPKGEPARPIELDHENPATQELTIALAQANAQWPTCDSWDIIACNALDAEGNFTDQQTYASFYTLPPDDADSEDES